jgi:hypothetical protein
MKSLTLIFYGSDGEAAKARASQIRAERGAAHIRDAAAFAGEVEPCDSVVLLPCVSGYDRARIVSTYPDKVAIPGAPVVPPPPGLPDPLAGLPADWRNEHGTRLKSLAQAVSGRSVENKEQAIDIIATALAARG